MATENPRVLRRDVEEAREQLGETLDALAHKANAPRRAAARARAGLSPSSLGIAVAVVLGLVVLGRLRSPRR